MQRLNDKIENLNAERRLVLAVLSKLLPSVVSYRTPSEDGEDYEFDYMVYMRLPTGKQVSFGIGSAAREAWFSHLPIANITPWDGHGTEEKWNRIVAYIDGSAE